MSTAVEVWSYPTFPPPLRVNYLIQIPKAIGLYALRDRYAPLLDVH